MEPSVNGAAASRRRWALPRLHAAVVRDERVTRYSSACDCRDADGGETPPLHGTHTSSHSRRTAAFAFNAPGVPSNTMAPCPMT
jgi:hypothetical protein